MTESLAVVRPFLAQRCSFSKKRCKSFWAGYIIYLRRMTCLSDSLDSFISEQEKRWKRWGDLLSVKVVGNITIEGGQKWKRRI